MALKNLSGLDSHVVSYSTETQPANDQPGLDSPISGDVLFDEPRPPFPDEQPHPPIQSERLQNDDDYRRLASSGKTLTSCPERRTSSVLLRTVMLNTARPRHRSSRCRSTNSPLVSCFDGVWWLPTALIRTGSSLARSSGDECQFGQTRRGKRSFSGLLARWTSPNRLAGTPSGIRTAHCLPRAATTSR